MKILVVGNGGREHALLWKLSRDAPDSELFVTRGNGGTAGLATALPLDADDASALAGWAEANGIGLTIVGPEGPLADGIADVFERRGLPLFGPSKAAAAIESSKAYAKELMARAGVPTAEFATFRDLAAAENHIHEHGAPLVVKASGLAGGKGAVVCTTVEEALDAARAMLHDRVFGGAGYEIVIEEMMTGEEVSILALTDGEHAIPLLPAQDHKRIGEGDTGPNTGGMGAYTPVSLVDDALLERIMRDVFIPTLAALRDDNATFRGVLYAGLMLTPTGPRVVEFNARFGDPEAEAILPLLKSSLLEPMLAIANGESLASAALQWDKRAALTTILASEGYPGAVAKDKRIDVHSRVLNDDDIVVFHSGTILTNGQLLTNGGRVFAVTGLGDTLAAAASKSRSGAKAISFQGKQYRRDIGAREIARNA